MSGQISDQVPNQAGTQLTGLPQQNENSLNMEPARRFMQEKIYEFLMQRQQQPHEIPTKRVLDIVSRLEEGLFKTAATKEEYMNLESLENRLHVFINRPHLNNQNQQFPQVNSSTVAVGPMIPTPGLKMNVQARMPQQISDQVPNQQNGNHDDHGMEPARRFMQEKIYEFLMQRQQQAHEIPTKSVLDIVSHLEEGLFKTAATEEEYMNLESLANRLHVLIKRPHLNNQNQQFPQVNSSTVAVGPMIPTPGSKMNAQAHISRQISNQVPNQQNENYDDRGMEPARRFMQEKIHDILMQRHAHELPSQRVLDMTRRLDEGLLKAAATKEEYMDMETLENRINSLSIHPQQ